MSRKGRSIKTENRLVVAREWGVTANEYKDFLRGEGDENVLKFILVMVTTLGIY